MHQVQIRVRLDGANSWSKKKQYAKNYAGGIRDMNNKTVILQQMYFETHLKYGIHSTLVLGNSVTNEYVAEEIATRNCGNTSRYKPTGLPNTSLATRNAELTSMGNTVPHASNHLHRMGQQEKELLQQI